VRRRPAVPVAYGAVSFRTWERLYTLRREGEDYTSLRDALYKLMPADPGGDAMHLALASYHKCDFLVTWNCRHLANASRSSASCARGIRVQLGPAQLRQRYPHRGHGSRDRCHRHHTEPGRLCLHRQGACAQVRCPLAGGGPRIGAGTHRCRPRSTNGPINSAHASKNSFIPPKTPTSARETR
jgi:hypothetical protein